MKRLLLLLTGLLLSISSLQAQNPGELDLTFNADGVNFGDGANGVVYKFAILSDGKVLIGGDFTSYNGTTTNRIGRLNADGSLDKSFNLGTGANGAVSNLIIQPDGKILIGGWFTSFNGTPRNRIARLNSDGTLDSSFNPGTGTDRTVRTMALQIDGKILISGDFTSYNGTPRNGIARLNANGSLDTTFNPGSGSSGIYSIAIQSDGRVLIGGFFFSYNNIEINSIARINSNGSLDTSFNPGFGPNGNFSSGVILSLALQQDGKILIGGSFNSYNNIERNNIARINTNGSLDTSFNPGTGSAGQVQTITQMPDGKILIGGDFISFNGTPRSRIARLNANGSLDSAFNPGTGTNTTVYSTAFQSDGKIFIGGAFSTYSGITRNRLARLNANGSLDTSFNPSTGANLTVWDMVLQPDGKILIGGFFTSYNGSGRNYIARLYVDGSLDTSFNPGTGANGIIRSILLQPDGKILIGGEFTSYNGTSRNYIARINSDGSLDTSFNPGLGANTTVYRMVLQPDGKILIGGDFTSINGTSRNFIARINADGTLDTSFNPGTGANSTVRSIVLQPDGKIWIGGGFSSYNGTSRNRIALLNEDGSLDLSFISGSGVINFVLSMVLQSDGKILIGGNFSSYNGINIKNIARLNSNGDLDTSFNPGTGANNPVLCMVLKPDGSILIGGAFINYNGTSRNYIAGLNSDGSLDTSFNPGTGANNLIYSMTPQSDSKILIGGNFTGYNEVSRVRIARIYGGREALDEEAPTSDLETIEPVNAQCQVSFEDLTIPTATDLVDGVIQGSTDQSIFPITTQGRATITWTYADEAGNKSTQTQEIIVDDTTKPVPILETLPTITGECSATVNAPTANDNCKGTITGTTTDPTEYSEQGTFEIIWTYDDGNGNTSTQTQTVIVKDVTAPVPTSQTLSDVTGECAATVTTVPTSLDNCKGTILGTTEDQLTYNTQGTHTITWKFDDGNGNKSQQTQRVIVKDITAPVPTSETLADVTGECAATVTTVPTALDNCQGTIQGTTTDPLTYNTQGTHTVTWKFDDGNGNTSQQTQTVIVKDVIAPVPTSESLADVTGECAATVTIVPTALDNCQGTIQGTTTDPLTYNTQGTHTITWNFDDGNGNTSQQTQTVIVKDVIAPVPTSESLADVTGECAATVTTVPTVLDNCQGTILGTTEDLLTYNTQGTHTITWKFDDGNGNTSQQTQTVIVKDVTAPVPTLETLADVTGECAATVTTVPTALDNCKGTITGTTEDPLTYNTQGTHTITWKFDDGNGNSSQQTQTVIVKDVTAPVPTSETLADVIGECAATVTTVPTALDNCKGTITGTTEDPLTYNTQGTHSVTWKFDDGNGNTSQQTQTVIVKDVTAPVPTSETLADVIGECAATVTTVPTALDNCKGTITGTTEDPLTYNTQGTHSVTWKFDDGNGNTSQQTQTVIVKDITAPVPTLETLADVTGECAATVTIVPTALDNCQGTIQGTTTDPLTYNTQGTHTITWNFDDGNGNTSQQTQTVIVKDVTAPVPTSETLADVTVECAATVTTVPTANDNCKGTIKGTTEDPLTYNTQGTHTITWKFDDGNGNTSQQTQTVIVKDVTAPVPTLETLADVTGECAATVTTVPTALDNCQGTILGTTEDPLTYNTQGTHSITWNFDDGNGNTSQQTQTVIVKDVTAPVPTLETLADVTGECAATVTTVPTALDNCQGTILGTTEDPLTYNTQGTHSITWNFDDGNGNTSQQTQTVIVKDITAPVPTLETLADVTGECAATVTTVPTALDNCKGTIQGTTTDLLTYNTQGTHKITWKFDDGNGNISQQTQTVIVKDITAPVPTFETLADVTGECAATVTTVPTALDSCKGTITGTTEDPLTYSTQGTHTITWKFDDGNGNIAQQTQTVIVKDVTAPVPTFETLADVTGECAAATVTTVPTALDNCKGTIQGTTTDPLTYNTQGTHTITWKFDDGNGNISQQTQTVIVKDITAPVPILESLADVTGECAATVTTVPTALDNCKGSITGTTTDPLTYNTQGTHTITWKFDDGNGNTSQQTQKVIVKDVTAPVPTSEILADVTGECAATVTTVPTALDNCQGMITGTTTDPLTYNTQGTHTITWKFDDGNGNTSQQTQTVIVKDVTAPVPTVETLADVTGECAATVTTVPTALDSCKGTITGTTEDPLTYSTQGTHTITWKFDDGNGNIAQQIQTVIVKDITAPIPTSETLADVTGECAATVTTVPTALDNCKGTITGTTEDPLTYSTQGTHTITWKFDDGNGNTSQQTQTVIVKDITAPVPSLAQLPIIMGECSATVSAPTAIDSCQGIITGTTADPVSYGVQGTYTINWIFDDGNGNIVTQEQTVILEDIIAPVPTLSTLPTITTETSVVVFGSLASDNCEGAIIGTTSDPTSYSEQGTYTITWFYRDSKGNTSTQNQTVIVNAATTPVWNTLPGSLDRTLYCSQDHLLAQAQLLAPAPSDPDRVVSLVKTSGGFVMSGPNGAGTFTNTWIATDLNGIQSQVFTQVITFQGIEIDASASSIPVQVGTSATLSATVLPAVSGVKVTFLLDGNQVGFANTDVTGKATISVPGLSLDVYKVTAVVGSGCSESIAYLPVYDPNGNFVTGGGWINSPEGALIGTTTVGKANFGFVSKYKKGSNQVDGNTEFQFNAGNLSFKSILHEAGTLVISGKKATYRGEGSINGVSGFKFTLVAIDGQWNGGTNPDQFRIKIWGSNGVIYDNGLGADENSEVSTVLGGGSIVIHESKTKGNKRVSAELITVPWNTPFETIRKKVDQMSSTWFESRKLLMTLDAGTYDPLTPGLYVLKADLTENEFFELDEPIAIQVLVQDKPKALDIKLSNQKVVKNAGFGTVIGTLNTIDSVDDIHTYSMDPNPDLEIRGNQLIWKGTETPAVQMKITVFSTDRAGQTISKDIILTREVGPNQFILYPNPAQNETNIMVDLDEGAEVEIKVFDAVGRMVIEDTIYRESTFIQTIDLNGLAPGMYMVQVKIGYILMTERLIKR